MTTSKPNELVHAFLKRIHTAPETVTITTRQAEKFSRRLTNIAPNGNIDDTIAKLVEIAEQRILHAGPTVYIANIGSSGSHWLQALLSHAAGLMPCGETYFPEEQLNELHEGNDVRQVFIHAVYAVMGWASPADKATAAAVNTAHKPFLPHVKTADKGAKSVLLVRDPLDVVMSRTFRKDEYRTYLGEKETDDMDYLKRNARYVRSFYRKSLKHDFDITVRYEDIRQDPINTVKNVFEAIDLAIDEKKIQTVVADLHAESTPGSKAAPPAEAHLAAAKFITAEVREALGYI